VNTNSRRLRFVIRSLTAVYSLVLLTLTHLPPTELPKTQVNDKLVHFTMYGLLAVLLHLSLWTRKRSPVAIASIVVPAALLFGAFDELTQPFFQRTCDIRDWYADAVGVLFAVICVSIVTTLISRPSRQAGV
jgi:VanZ family protein